MSSQLSYDEAFDVVVGLKEKISETIFGQEELIQETLCCFLSAGHCLMTGAPGLAKTTLVRVFAQNLGLAFARVQFTPDLLPSDIIGSEILNVDQETGRRHFDFSNGPVFTNLLLADEINRASPRTQSALLEAMQERQVTVAGKVHQLPNPFMVFATQNPFESEGTFPLPEAQLDRFLIHSYVTYPSEDAELRILEQHKQNALFGEQRAHENKTEKPSLDADVVMKLSQFVQQITVETSVLTGIRHLVRMTRPQDESQPKKYSSLVWYGAGPRAGISLISTCRALALLSGDKKVKWGHVKRLAKPVLRHRIRLTASASRDGVTEDSLIDEFLEHIEQESKNLVEGIS